MGNLRAGIGTSAIHLCIDMQRMFAPGGPWVTPWMDRVVPVLVPFIERYQQSTLFTRFIPAKSPESAPGTWQSYYRKWHDMTLDHIDHDLIELVPPLMRFSPPAEIFDRRQYSAFADGRLHRHLLEKRIDTLVITGSETDVCVLSSVLSAVDHGYRVIIASDAVCSSADESHDHLLQLYRRRFDIQIELSDIAEITRAWHT